MGILKDYSRRVADAGRMDNVQSISQASTGTRVNNFGATLLSNSSANNGFILDGPKKGLRKTLIADLNSTGQIFVYNASTSIVFFGTTSNSIAFTTGVGVKAVDMIGVSSAAWAITNQTTGVSLAASTISG